MISWLPVCALRQHRWKVHANVEEWQRLTPALIAVNVNSWLLTCVTPWPPPPPGAQSGLVPTDARYVSGEQRRRRGTERNPEPAGETGVHHAAGGQPVRTAEWAQGAGAYSLCFVLWQHFNTILSFLHYERASHYLPWTRVGLTLKNENPLLFMVSQSSCVLIAK